MLERLMSTHIRSMDTLTLIPQREHSHFTNDLQLRNADTQNNNKIYTKYAKTQCTKFANTTYPIIVGSAHISRNTPQYRFLEPTCCMSTSSRVRYSNKTAKTANQ